MPSDKPTRYAIICPKHGQVFLTEEEYTQQMFEPDARWTCPVKGCGAISRFDDDNYERDFEQEEVDAAGHDGDDGPSDRQLEDQSGYERDPFLFIDKDDPGRSRYYR